jgi:hypothetical protein
MEKRLNAYVAAFGEENKNNIVAAPSETGEGIRLVFDREHSLEPVPGGPIEQGYTNSSEDVHHRRLGQRLGHRQRLRLGIRVRHLVPADAAPCALRADLGAPHAEAPAARRAEAGRLARGQRRVVHECGGQHGVDRGARPSPALAAAGRTSWPTARRGAASRGGTADPHRADPPALRGAGEILRERLTALQQEYEQVIAQLTRRTRRRFAMKEEFENESNFEYTPTETSESGQQQQRRSPTPWPYPGRENRQKSLTPWAEPGNVPPNVCFSPSPSPSPPPVAGPSRMGPSMMEQHQQERGLRRQHAQHMFISPRKYTSSPGAEFVTVTQRVQRVGPSGTAVFDAFTNEPVLETRRYRVRADVLQGIDEDSDML